MRSIRRIATYFVLVLLTTLAVLAARPQGANAHPAREHPGGIIRAPLVHDIATLRSATAKMRRAKCVRAFPVKYRPAYRVPVSKRPAARREWQQRWAITKSVRASCIVSPQDAIRHVFGARAGEALSVAWCESRFSIYAQNGQYLGLFQMGSWERSTYGHGSTALAQSVAAHRYFVASGSDWSPWACKP